MNFRALWEDMTGGEEEEGEGKALLLRTLPQVRQ